MNTGANTRVVISNSISLVATDAAASGGVTKIVGLDGFPTGGTQSLQVRKNLVAQPEVATATITVVLSTSTVVQNYELDVYSAINGVYVTRRFTYTAPVAGTVAAATAAMAASFTAWVAAQSFDGTVVVTSSTSPTIVITATASTTAVLMKLIAPVPNLNIVIASAMGTVTISATSGAQTIGQPVSITKVAHGLVSGNTIVTTALTGGVAAYVGKVSRVTRVDADTITLDDIIATATTAITAGTLTLVAQPAFGTVANVNANALANGSSDTATQTTYQYDCVQIAMTYPASTGSAADARVVNAILWYPSSLIATPYTVVNNLFEGKLITLSV